VVERGQLERGGEEVREVERIQLKNYRRAAVGRAGCGLGAFRDILL